MTSKEVPHGDPRLAPGPRRMAAGAALALALACGFSVLAGCREAKESTAGGQSASPAALMSLRSISAVEREAYVGRAACVACHRPEAAEVATHHAATLAAVDTPEQLGRFRAAPVQNDPAMGTAYQPRVLNGRAVIEARRGSRTDAVTADYAIGSGDRGVTYLSCPPAGTVELRLSYYRDANRWDFSPRQPRGTPTDTPVGRSVSDAEEALCFACHATAVVTTGGHVLPGASIVGIGCERCHGPGREHLEAVRRGDRDLRMADLATMRKRVSVEVCGQCHSSPSGDDVNNPQVAIQLARLQSTALARSACYQRSDLACVSCHDPHGDLPRQASGRYNRICAGCHTRAAAAQISCPIHPQGDCVRCHMPLQAVDRPPVPKFHNHWIGIWDRPGQTAPRPPWPM